MNDPVQVYSQGQVTQPAPPPVQVDPVVSQQHFQQLQQSPVQNLTQFPQQPVQNDVNRPGAMPAVFSQVISDQADQYLQDQQVQQSGYPMGKEQPPVISHEVGYDVISGQPVEIEHRAEISPEVEKFIEEVQENDGQIPQEVVVADKTVVQPTGHYVAKPVIVLPMTEQELKHGKKASPLMSKRWLAEWVEKIMKMFEGSVVYREE